ncbi:HPF/RaiA family ribosome-associated protein [Hwanghaeella sp.]|uniref:HPF/RaiA family ribosome-associated protein n=1 Tax=Hwanghaeella sp. TaxID=2605943 RepID=UPI003CCBDB8E
MAINLEITYRDFDAPIMAEERINERVAKLERIFPRLQSLRVVSEQVQHNRQTGKLYRFRLDAVLPGGDVTIDKSHADKDAHADFFVAMRDAFNALESRLHTFADKQNLDVKHHEDPPHGVVKEVFPDHGFIKTSDGLEIYFHANSVVDGKFKDVEVGTEVRFSAVDNESAKGPQATSVHLVGKHHLH